MDDVYGNCMATENGKFSISIRLKLMNIDYHHHHYHHHRHWLKVFFSSIDEKFVYQRIEKNMCLN